MLDSETKRRIDSCRDILVGKVPDPKSQVEQITIALIYKFMDDMDREAAEFGDRTFFAGEFAKYGWEQLMRPGVGGHEMLALYSEAIQKMNENAGIPELFRDIFKNAYLPYRDPETLRTFLKEINGFTYDHSERLGDAFEYLLSVLGSQGDAGQFRTPRHIIDFMVEVIDPQKGESILDPACGTAGFLISAWKHILKQNTDKKPGDKLTPDAKRKLIANIKGFDISPDMVRLSLVNLYLHGFTDPHIYEYDTLTSEDRWNETADVILANPPFMSPKGGIKPHKRFSIQAKRSEVLFVDYMAEHLTPKGRAAIIVPEGIIFQSQTAYKQLRKLLVETSLVAVISLPAGCFNPYSGVKTSILILDKSIAKQSNTIAFFKVENDGFGLGAQRREIEKNDLPRVKVELAEYLQTLRNNQPTADLQFSTGLITSKEMIAENGDYNLSGGRYGSVRQSTNQLWPFVELGSVCLQVTDGSHFSPETVNSGYPYVTVKDLDQGHIDLEGCKKINESSYKQLVSNGCKPKRGDVLFSKDGTVGKTAIVDFDRDFVVLSSLAIITPNTSQVLPEFIYCVLSSDKFISDATDNKTGVAIRRIVLRTLKSIQIPLPPLDVQKEIVAEIEGYQKVVDGARAVLDNYRPHIPIHPDWPIEKFGEVISTITPPAKIQAGDFSEVGRYPVIDQSQNAIAGRTDDESTLIDGSNGLVVFGDHTCAVKYVNEPFAQGADGIKIIQAGEQLVPKFIFFYLQSHPIEQDGYKRHFGKLKESRIPIPPIATQQAIVADIEAEQALVAANRELIERFESKIQTSLARVWGEE
ncbi:restriction endonuclease subunit M/S [Mariprofundus erugo]|uniref:site-specific DNA-methyltransferase (adenine-specific) n=1 Tax=Mariprofundus erugo TaxID=2528639 RepID=A0A5R9GWR6_9PROT|nr:N-6 DNA methylase [Mariprofundus erugo]TLS68643.1 restriction endonuclease subunit M/S [Mariprofundus erugo]